MPVNDDPYHVFTRQTGPSERAICLGDGTVLAALPFGTSQEQNHLFLRHYDELERVTQHAIRDFHTGKIRTYSVARGLTPESDPKPCYRTLCNADGLTMTWHAPTKKGEQEAQRWLKTIRHAYAAAMALEQKAMSQSGQKSPDTEAEPEQSSVMIAKCRTRDVWEQKDYRDICLLDGTVLATVRFRTDEECWSARNLSRILDRVVKQGAADADLNKEGAQHRMVIGHSYLPDENRCFRIQSGADGEILAEYPVGLRGLVEARQCLNTINRAYELSRERALEAEEDHAESSAPAL